jgi:hypothetical protein
MPVAEIARIWNFHLRPVDPKTPSRNLSLEAAKISPNVGRRAACWEDYYGSLGAQRMGTSENARLRARYHPASNLRQIDEERYRSSANGVTLNH